MEKQPEFCLLWIDHWSTCMTKGEWSGWLQAFFSIVAIVFAAVLSRRQSASQHATTMQAIEAQHVYSRAAAATAALALVGSALVSLRQIAKTLSDRSAVHERVATLRPLFDEHLGHITSAIDALGLKELPVDAVGPMALVSRQLWDVRSVLLFVVDHHGKMSGSDFDGFFKSLKIAVDCLEKQLTVLHEISSRWQDPSDSGALFKPAKA